MASTEAKLWFLSSVEHFWPDPKDTLSKFGLFFEKMHKVFKNKAQRCSTPLSLKVSTTILMLIATSQKSACVSQQDLNVNIEGSQVAEFCP